MKESCYYIAFPKLRLDSDRGRSSGSSWLVGGPAALGLPTAQSLFSCADSSDQRERAKGGRAVACGWLAALPPWNVELSWWLTELEPGAKPQPNRTEVAGVRWLTVEQMRQLPTLLISNHHFLDAMQRREIQLFEQ